MTENDLKTLRGDSDGLLTYEYLANHIGECGPDDINALIDNMVHVDLSGQFMASAARYLNAIDPEGYAPAIRELVAGAIDKDREHRYLPDLLLGLYGPNYQDRAVELCAADDNFRRIYKRLFPTSVL
ncbi:MAG: hypothetical protein K2K22_03395 [Muribaculaceae bacterium]|nr:hypothetical protein [Muribaculaceae bacterium]MDE6611586.1 hypothetical protein [Muribaculaceae bacterium]